MCPIQWDRVQLNWTWFFSSFLAVDRFSAPLERAARIIVPKGAWRMGHGGARIKRIKKPARLLFILSYETYLITLLTS